MAAYNEYVEYIQEQLLPLGGVTARAMFGGISLYLDGICFALVIDDVLYLKADALTVPDFVDHDLAPFTYQKKDGTSASMSYYPLPAEVLEDSELLVNWARSAFDVALRAKAKKSLKKPKK